MLRLLAKQLVNPGALVGPAPAPPQIVRDFADPYIELVRLLYEAANIEHALLVQYLAAAFSIKPAYAAITGSPIGPNAFSILGVAIQEMLHLHDVNALLTALGASPRLEREDFPIQSPIYPFPLEIRPMSAETLARYVYAEAPAAVFSGDASAADSAFRDRVLALLGHQHVNHLGGLYTNILAQLSEVMKSPPAVAGDLSKFPAAMEAIKVQGEGPHYVFFRSLLEGTALGLAGPQVWDDPKAEAHPSFNLLHGLSAFAGDPKAIGDEDARKVAWLGDLHYWIALALLDMGYRFNRDDYVVASKSHMRAPTYRLGLALATRGYCMPFDLPTLPIPWGVSEGQCRFGIFRLVAEAQTFAQGIRNLLPADFPFATVDSTLELLKE